MWTQMRIYKMKKKPIENIKNWTNCVQVGGSPPSLVTICSLCSMTMGRRALDISLFTPATAVLPREADAHWPGQWPHSEGGQGAGSEHAVCKCQHGPLSAVLFLHHNPQYNAKTLTINRGRSEPQQSWVLASVKDSCTQQGEQMPVRKWQ